MLILDKTLTVPKDISLFLANIGDLTDFAGKVDPEWAAMKLPITKVR